jgi:hypothetical protein
MLVSDVLWIYVMDDLDDSEYIDESEQMDDSEYSIGSEEDGESEVSGIMNDIDCF